MKSSRLKKENSSQLRKVTLQVKSITQQTDEHAFLTSMAIDALIAEIVRIKLRQLQGEDDNE